MLDLFVGIAGIVISLGAALTGWVFKMVFSAIKEVEENTSSLAKSLADHEIYAEKTFATKQDVRDGFDRVMTKLDKIDEKLDLKADKKGG